MSGHGAFPVHRLIREWDSMQGAFPLYHRSSVPSVPRKSTNAPFISSDTAHMVKELSDEKGSPDNDWPPFLFQVAIRETTGTRRDVTGKDQQNRQSTEDVIKNLTAIQAGVMESDMSTTRSA